MFKKFMSFGAVVLLLVSLSISQVGLTDVFAKGASISGGVGASSAGRSMSAVVSKASTTTAPTKSSPPPSVASNPSPPNKGFADTSIAGKTQAAQIQTDKSMAAKQAALTKPSGGTDTTKPVLGVAPAVGPTPGTSAAAVKGTTVTRITNVYQAPRTMVVERHWYTPFYHPTPVIVVGSSYGSNDYHIVRTPYYRSSGWNIFLYFLLAACIIALVVSITRRM